MNRDHAWPIAIALWLLLVVAVNIAFTWIAVSDPPEIVPSYDDVHSR